MDEETKEELKEIKTIVRTNGETINEVSRALGEHIAESRVLKIPERVTAVENGLSELDYKKASWNGIYAIGVLAVAMLGAIVGVASCVQKGVQ